MNCRHVAPFALISALSLSGMPAYAGGISYIVGGSNPTRLNTGVTVIAGHAPDAARATLSVPLHRDSICAQCGYASVAPIIDAASSMANVDPSLVAAVIKVESGFNRDATSPRGARGLMQLMPATASRLGVSNVADPVQNIAAGTFYLGALIHRFAGNVSYALAAYNAGEANVRAYGGIPPFAETRAYVPQVLSQYARFRSARDERAQ
ncbi:soluble lytic murein transglycosylase [Pararobbsia alpina]|uniref:lytic transglycosylase domain-containing protein n=1 Tax=Pararobbsia alpina TaxID=621374 RepID=UPI0039A498A1